jgi:diguanylate cyclase (GGDEF)-like protein
VTVVESPVDDVPHSSSSTTSSSFLRSPRVAFRGGAFGLLAILIGFTAVCVWAAAGVHQAQVRADSEASAAQAYRQTLRAFDLESPAQISSWSLAGPENRDALAGTAELADQGFARIDEVVSDRELRRDAAPLQSMHARYLRVARDYFGAISDGRTGRADALMARTLRPLSLALAARLSARANDHSAAAQASLRSLSTTVAELRLAAIVALPLGILCLGTALWAGWPGRRREDAELRVELERLQRDALTDSITGLGNYTRFQDELEREVARGLRHGQSLSLALIAVDRYQALSDEFGHHYADQVLAVLGKFLGGRRTEDQTYRLNGGEFASILPGTTAREVYPLMERLRAQTEAAGYRTTITIGIADLMPSGDSIEALRHRAEAALNEAKQQGRNTVVAFASKGSGARQVS